MVESRSRSNPKNPLVGGCEKLRPEHRPDGLRRSSQGRAIRQNDPSLAIDSELSSNSPISAQEIEAICLLLGDDLDSLFRA